MSIQSFDIEGQKDLVLPHIVKRWTLLGLQQSQSSNNAGLQKDSFWLLKRILSDAKTNPFVHQKDSF